MELSFFSSPEKLLLRLQRDVRLSHKVATILLQHSHFRAHTRYRTISILLKHFLIGEYSGLTATILVLSCFTPTLSLPILTLIPIHLFTFYLQLSCSLHFCSYFLNKARWLFVFFEKLAQLCFFTRNANCTFYKIC